MKLTLDQLGLYDDFTVWALSTDAPITRLCFFLNEACKLRLCRCKNDLKLNQKDYLFSHFSYEQPSVELEWYLTSNTSYYNNGEDNTQTKTTLFEDGSMRTYHLIPSLKSYNAFLWVYGELSTKELKKVNETLKTLPNLKTFKMIDLSVTNKVENLITQI